jgi:hypothetical protein
VIQSYSLFAQDFWRSELKYKVGEVLSVSGKAIAYGNFNRTIQYLNRGDQVSQRFNLVTRSSSEIKIKLGNHNIITIAENSRVALSQIKDKYLLRLYKGSVRYRYNGSGTPNLFVSGKSIGVFYSSNQFDAVMNKKRFYFRRIGKGNVYKFKRNKSGNKKDIQIGSGKLELITSDLSNNRPVYLLKKSKGTDLPKVNSQGTVEESSVFDSEGLSEAAAIFGDDLISKTTASSTQDAESLFSDDNKSEAQSIFGDEVDVKSSQEKKKIKDNIGVRLDRISVVPERPLSLKGEEKEESFFKDFDISLFSKSTLYSATPRSDVGKVDSSSFHQDLRVNVGNKLNLSEAESLSFSGWIEASNRKGVYNDLGGTFDLRSSKRNFIHLNELYYTYSTRKFDVQFGKKVLKQGKGIAYSPTDSISATDVTVPTSPLFLGNFIISVDYYLEDWTLTGILFPTIVPNKAPTQNSRWTTLYSDIDFELDQEFPSGFSPKTKQIFLKLEGTYLGTDWLFSFFNGPNSNPVIRNDIVVNGNVPSFTLVQEHVPITFMSMGFSTTFGSLELHGEILNQNADEGRDDSFLATMLGFRYTMDNWPKAIGLNSIDTIIEYGAEKLKSAQSRPFYALSSIGSRIYQNSILGTIIFNVSDELSFNYDFHLDNKNDGSAKIFGVNYNSGKSQWRLKFEAYDGSDDSNFGLWRDNDNSTLEYIYNF